MVSSEEDGWLEEVVEGVVIFSAQGIADRAR
jgi:hypothetical protein